MGGGRVADLRYAYYQPPLARRWYDLLDPRRCKFFESRTSAPVLAHAALARIRQLYAVEHAAEDLSAEGRCALRQRDAVPLLTAFAEWLTEQGRHVLPKSPIGQAIAYAQPNWAALLRYTESGELSIDNNLAERMLRALAIGRRNWTFLGSDRGGRTAAVLYSLTSTCKHHDIDPFAYLRTADPSRRSTPGTLARRLARGPSPSPPQGRVLMHHPRSTLLGTPRVCGYHTDMSDSISGRTP
jgi:hypothetical protein